MRNIVGRQLKEEQHLQEVLDHQIPDHQIEIHRYNQLTMLYPSWTGVYDNNGSGSKVKVDRRCTDIVIPTKEIYG